MKGERIGGRYEIEQRLGHGGMATVYRARDRELHRSVALKLLADNLAGDDDLRKRFKREARLAAKLDHPNVVQVFDVGEEDERPYIVMEHVDGGTLGDRLKRRRKGLRTEEAVPLLQQLCEGLAHAHERKLVHRDVKPQNLLLRKADGCLKIADFGIARAAEETRLTETGRVIGTDRYMAPEQLADGELTPATDVYAVGVVADEMLPAKRPPALQEIIERCLRDEPGERFKDGAALGEALESVNGAAAPTAPLVSHTGAEAEPPTRPTSMLPRTRGPRDAEHTRRRFPDMRAGAGLAAALIAGLLVVVGLIAALSGGSDSRTEQSGQSGGAKVQPAPSLDDPAEQARAYADWLRQQTR